MLGDKVRERNKFSGYISLNLRNRFPACRLLLEVANSQ
jgi:hypothetical protein